MASHDIPEKELKNVLSLSTITTGIKNEKGVYRVKYLCLGTTLNSERCIETKKLNPCLCHIHPTRKMSKLLLLHDNTSTHGGVHHCTVLAHLPYVLTLQSGFQF